MDGFEDRHEVIVMAATNRPDVLDAALLRPGRFDRQVTVGLPDRPGREAILRVHTEHLRLAPDVNIDVLARATTGFSGADLANLANEAALVAVRVGHEAVTADDFATAIDKIMLGGERPLILNDEDRRIVAYHEAGHALVAWLTPCADPVQKVTIIPRGRALGITQQLPGEDKYNYTRTYLLARLSVMLGGRAAEETALGDITTGAEQDLMQASRLVRRMITQWGMGELGLAAFEAGEAAAFLGPDYATPHNISETTSARVEQNVENVLGERYGSVCTLLIESGTGWRPSPPPCSARRRWTPFASWRSWARRRTACRSLRRPRAEGAETFSGLCPGLLVRRALPRPVHRPQLPEPRHVLARPVDLRAHILGEPGLHPPLQFRNPPRLGGVVDAVLPLVGVVDQVP